MDEQMGGHINAFGVSQTHEVFIQRQERSGSPEGKSGSEPVLSSPTRSGNSARTSRCYTTPEFPDFRCLASALKLDIDENVWINAHQFYRVASLFPGDNELMWNTFWR